jgi:hypothetical protein
MKRYRFNTKVGKSAGIGAYRNKGSDYYEYAPLFRDCSKTGRLDIIGSLIDYSTTIYGSKAILTQQEYTITTIYIQRYGIRIIGCMRRSAHGLIVEYGTQKRYITTLQKSLVMISSTIIIYQCFTII